MPTRKRTVSLIASATEIVCALGRARLAGRPQPRMRFPGRCGLAAGAHRAQIQDRGQQRRDRRPRAGHRARGPVRLSRGRRGAEGAGARRDRHAGSTARCAPSASATWKPPPAPGPGGPVEIVSLKPELDRRRLRRHPPCCPGPRCRRGRRQLDARTDRGSRRSQPVRRRRQAFRLDAVGGTGCR